MSQPDGIEPHLLSATRDDVRELWGSAAAGWRRWEPFFAACTWPVTLRLLMALEPRPGSRVLDVGCGIGDPGLQIASIVGPDGHVVSLDLAEEMVEVARARASALGLSNIQHRVAAVEDLDRDGAPFDAIVARFVIGLLEDPIAALVHLREMLVPGGRLAMASWASTDVNRMFGIPREQLAKHVKRPKPAADTPGPLRFAKPGQLERLLDLAGFAEVQVIEVEFYNFARDPSEYFEMVYDTAVNFRTSFDPLTAEQQRDVRAGLMAAVAEHEVGGVIRVPAVARVASGVRGPD